MANCGDFFHSLDDADNTTLPNDPLFQKLLTIAHSDHAAIPLIQDLNAGSASTAHTLLDDVLSLRRKILKCLPDRVIQQSQQGEDTFITLSADGGYEFAVGILAILSINACAALVSTAMPSTELYYHVSNTKSAMILSSERGVPAANKLVREYESKLDGLVILPIRRSVVNHGHTHLVPLSRIWISNHTQTNPNGPGIIIFTSGTTGPPKAVVIRRSTITTGAQSLANQLELQPTHKLLHLLPVHHATGVNLSFFPFLMAGACIEFRPGGFDSHWVWDRWRRGDVTHFTGVPTMYVRLMRFWEQHISLLSQSEQNEYARGAARLEAMYCGTSALPSSVSQFWRVLRKGRPILQRYGSTETQIAISMSMQNWQGVPDGSVGKASIGVQVKIAGSPKDTEGELLVKSPYMFASYLNDDTTTRAAHDENGYYKTGDIVKKQGEYYFILGRASIDILKSGGFKISALDIEREIVALPYVSEVMVVGVPDDEFGQRVAAAVTLRVGFGHVPKLTLEALREDLRSKLAGYKLPTLLRVVAGELPINASGKVVKKTLGPLYFPPTYRQDADVQVWTQRAHNRQITAKI